MSIICLYVCIYIYIYIYTCTYIDMCLNFWCLRISCKLWKALSTTGDTTVYDALIGCCFSFWQRISGRAKAFCVGYLSSIVAMLVAGTFWNPVQTDVGCWFKPLCGHWYTNPVGIPRRMMFSPGIIQKLPTCKLVKDSTLRLNRSSRDLQWWDQKTRSKPVISFPQVDGTHPQRSSTYWGIICVIYIYIEW